VPSNEQRRAAAKRKLERQLANRAERARKRRIIGVVGTIVGVFVVVGLVYWFANSEDTPTNAATTSDLNIPTEMAPAQKRPTPLPAKVTCDYPAEADKPAAKPVQPPATADISAEGTVQATISMSVGDVKVTLDRTLAPCTGNSFISLAKQNYFNDTGCHRLTTGEGLQVLQCGDPTGQGGGGPGYSFNDEVYPELKYGRGILAMANAGKDPATGKGSNGSQFFIVWGKTELPPNYTVFGTVEADSFKGIDEVAKAGVASGGKDGAPKNPVAITSVTVAS
jgi:peptidyl-prolyl cis-trans isomerase B (cyclophilin B)